LNRAFKDRDHEKVTHPTGGLIFAMVVNFLMSTVVNILVDIHKHLTTFKNPDNNTKMRIQRGQWTRPSHEQINQFRDIINNLLK
ncbi:hypothetical protein M4D58_26115, partial [Brevibacillus borstelensis]|uniref:hypothetical protein n=1 Tax=Brevibacillus borstelensis TaxID=45462 RepID=UPI00204125DF